MRVKWVASRSVLEVLRLAPRESNGIACITTYVTTPVPDLRNAILDLAGSYHIHILASPIAVATIRRRDFYLDLEASDRLDPARSFRIAVLKFPLLHAKTALLRTASHASLLVGSSNLTRGGLEMNEEANVLVSGGPDEPIFVEHEAWFHGLWARATPLNEYIAQVPPVAEDEFLDAVGRYDAADLDVDLGEPAGKPTPHIVRGGPDGIDDAHRGVPVARPNVPLGAGASTNARDSRAVRPSPRRDNFLDLYHYQQRALELAIEELRRGGSPCLGLPTGGGKTEVAIQIIRRYFLQPAFRVERAQKRLLVVTPKRELCAQFYNLLRERVTPSEAHVVLYQDGGFVSGEREAIPDRPLVLVATDQAVGRLNSPLMDRLGEAGLGRHRFDAFILDEAHHSPSDMYHYSVEELGRGPKPRVGLTATPFRLDREPLGFDRYIVARLPRLIEAGFLAQPNYVPVRTHTRYRISKSDLMGSKRDGGKDLSAKKLASIGRDKQRTAVIADEIVAQKSRRGWGRTIVFCASVEEAHNVADRLGRTLGSERVGCVVSTGNDEDDLGRDEAVDAFRLGELEVLVNCQIFIEGFDVPDADSIVIARPTMSLNYYKQMMGRGSRISVATQKTKFDLLDFVDEADLEDVDTALVHGNSPYGLFERGYEFVDGRDRDQDHDHDDEEDEVVYCDGHDHDDEGLLSQPFSKVVAELDPVGRAMAGSPFHRARGARRP